MIVWQVNAQKVWELFLHIQFNCRTAYPILSHVAQVLVNFVIGKSLFSVREESAGNHIHFTRSTAYPILS